MNYVSLKRLKEKLILKIVLFSTKISKFVLMYETLKFCLIIWF